MPFTASTDEPLDPPEPLLALVPHPDRLAGLAAILDVVRIDGATTRARLTSATGLSRAVVAQRVAELVEHGLLGVGELGRSTGGRAPRMIRFRADAGHLLVADIGATSVHAAVTNLSGSVLAHVEEPAEVAAGPEPTLERVDTLFRRCLERADQAPGLLLGIGIGVPGPVEFETGRPFAPPIMPGWDAYSVRERLAHWDVPLWVDNDVNVMALGELRAGIARGHRDVVVAKVGTGIGAGIVVRGRLHRGAQGCAGDVGHIEVVDAPSEVVCRCGKVNCLEALAGGAALGRDAEAAARDGRSPFLAALLEERGALDAEDVFRAATHGDPVAVELIAGAGRLIGGVLAGVVHFFNPSLIVVGGGVARSGDLLLASIRESVYRRSAAFATRELVVKRAGLDELGGVIGAAAMVTDELFSVRGLARWVESGTPAGRRWRGREVRRAVAG